MKVWICFSSSVLEEGVGKTSTCERKRSEIQVDYGQTREGFPQVNTSTYTREMYVCQCIGREKLVRH
jgi:hypothetical protein